MKKQLSNKAENKGCERKGGNTMKRLFNNKGMASVTTALIIAGSVITVLGTAGGVIGYNVYQEKKYEQEVATFLEEMDVARNNTVNDYNARAEQVMAELTFTDENGEAVSIDNNRNIDSMTNVVNTLNAIIEEINNNELLSQEQKDALTQALTEKVNSINERVATVNEENRIAEEQRIAAEEAAKAERAKAESKAKSQRSSGSTEAASSDDGNSSSGSSSNKPRWIDLGDGYGKYENEGGAWVEAHPEYGWDKRFYDRTGIFAAAVKMKEEHPNSTVHIYGMGVDQTF